MESVIHTPSTRHPDSHASPTTPSHAPSSSFAVRRVNSRRKLRSFLPRTTPSEFIQPSKNQTTGKLTGPPLSIRASDLKRQLQIQLVTPKSELIKPGRRGDNKPRPYELEPPPQAQKFPGNRCSDFYPWRGNHPEDHVTDSQARNGQYDKLFVGKGNNEQASARVVLAPALKQRNGLQLLSTLFLAALERRQTTSLWSSTSNFKPPPRMTLPENRREQWLKDLATVQVPLRKLSRTIPHGLKGTTLLEQCLSRKIPVTRAAWWIRCVGANELRGLRRKGVGSLAVGGEGKWIKEWTTQVLLFLDKIILSSSPAAATQWDQTFLYTLRLSLHLYAENLLDRQLFLEWVLNIPKSDPNDRFPIFLLFVSALWGDVVKQRKISSRFVEALNHSQKLNQWNDLSSTWFPRMNILSSETFCRDRRCLISPSTSELQYVWDSIDSRDPRALACLKNMSLRHDPKKLSTSFTSTTGYHSELVKLMTYLDRSGISLNLDGCWEEFSRPLCSPVGVDFLCRWAVTPLRSGICRVFFAARLISLISGTEVIIQSAILSFLDDCQPDKDIITNVNLLMSELVRRRCFSVPDYFRSLIASGRLSKYRDPIKPSLPIERHPLVHLPWTSLNPKLRNLRRILLQDCGYDADAEEQRLFDLRIFLENCGVSQNGAGQVRSLNAWELERFEGLSGLVKSQLSAWIRDTFGEMVVRDKPRGAWRCLTADDTVGFVETQRFVLARQVLEALQDIPALADVVWMIIHSDSCDLLQMAAETLSNHARSFSALGSLDGLVTLVFNRYTLLKAKHCLEKPLIHAVADLAAVISKGDILHEIQCDLATYDRDYPRSAAAPSPISESMGDIFDDDDLDDNNEIDRLWANNVIVDGPTFSRLFETTVSKMDASLNENGQTHIISAAQGLRKLREFDGAMFESMITGWMMRMRRSSHCSSFFKTVSLLIASSSVEIIALARVALAADLMSSDSSSYVEQYRFVAHTLDLILQDNPFPTELSVTDLYTLTTKRSVFIHREYTIILGLYRRMFELSIAAKNEELDEYTGKMIASGCSLAVFRSIAFQDPVILQSELVDPLINSQHPKAVDWVNALTNHILDDHESQDSSFSGQVTQLLTVANEFSVQICKLKLTILCQSHARDKSSRTRAGGLLASVNTISRSFIQGFMSTTVHRQNICAELLSVLNKDAAADVRSEVEELVLETSPILRNQNLLEDLDITVTTPEASEHLAKALLTLINATAFSIPEKGLSYMCSSLVDRLTKVLSSLDTHSTDEGLSDGESRAWLLVFLRLVTLHQLERKHEHVPPFDQARLFFALACLSQKEYVQNWEDISELMRDIMLRLSDGSISDDSRAHLRRLAKGNQLVPSIYYMLGSWDSAETLQSLQRGRAVDFSMKTWEKIEEPAVQMSDNDTCLGLGLFKARRT